MLPVRRHHAHRLLQVTSHEVPTLKVVTSITSSRDYPGRIEYTRGRNRSSFLHGPDLLDEILNVRHDLGRFLHCSEVAALQEWIGCQLQASTLVDSGRPSPHLSLKGCVWYDGDRTYRGMLSIPNQISLRGDPGPRHAGNLLWEPRVSDRCVVVVFGICVRETRGGHLYIHNGRYRSTINNQNWHQEGWIGKEEILTSR